VTVRRGKRSKQILDDLRKRGDGVTVGRGKRRKQILDDFRKREDVVTVRRGNDVSRYWMT